MDDSSFSSEGGVEGRKGIIHGPNPADFHEKVEAFLNGEGKHLGFQSVPEVLKQATREYLERHSK